MIIICQQIAVLQRFEWNNPERIGYVDSIESIVIYFASYWNSLSCVCDEFCLSIERCRLTRYEELYRLNWLRWHNWRFCKKIYSIVQQVAVRFPMIIVCQQIAVLQRFEWNNPDWIGYVDTIERFVRCVTPFKHTCVVFCDTDCFFFFVDRVLHRNDLIGTIPTELAMLKQLKTL